MKKLTRLAMVALLFIPLAIVLSACGNKTDLNAEANFRLAVAQTETDFTQFGETLDGRVSISNQDTTQIGSITYDVVHSEFDAILDKTLTGGGAATFTVAVPFHGEWSLNLTFNPKAKGIDAITRTVPLAYTASSYNFLISNATLPVAMATVKAFTKGDEYTYARLERGSTFDWAQSTEYFRPFPTQYVDRGASVSTAQNWMNSQEEPHKIVAYFKELYKLNPHSQFSYNVSENYGHYAYTLMLGAGIPADQMTINIYADGGSNLFALYDMDNEETYNNKLNALKSEIDDIIANGVEGKNLQFGEIHGDAYTYLDAFAEYGIKTNFFMIETVKDSILETIDALEDGDWKTAIRAKMEAFLTPETMEELFADLAAASAEREKEFEFLLKLRWLTNGEEHSLDEYFTVDEDKKALLIIGTSKTGEDNLITNTTAKGATFRQYIEWVVETYSAEYTIFYKGHPAWPVDHPEYSSDEFGTGVSRKDYFESNNIMILPNTTPAETYLYMFDDKVCIGGYWSSTFVSSKVGQSLFFFGNEDYIDDQVTAEFWNTYFTDSLCVDSTNIDTIA